MSSISESMAAAAADVPSRVVPDFTAMPQKAPPPDAGETSANLFVKDLHPDIDDDLLEAIFSKFGHVISAKVILHIHTAESRGHGFVLFARQEDAVRARGCVDGQRILGKEVIVRFSPQHQTGHLLLRNRTLFVRNIPRNVPERALLLHFQSFGTVETVEMGKDTARGAKAAFVVAKVTFATVDECDKALRAVHGKPNPFAMYALPTDPPVVKLLAKFAEPATERARRRAMDRASLSAAGDEIDATPVAADEPRTMCLVRARPTVATPTVAPSPLSLPYARLTPQLLPRPNPAAAAPFVQPASFALPLPTFPATLYPNVDPLMYVPVVAHAPPVTLHPIPPGLPYPVYSFPPFTYHHGS